MATPTLVGTVTSATSSATSYTCTKPTGVVAGDLLLSLQFSTGTIGSAPAGWTQAQTQTSGATSRVAYYAAGGAEPGSYSFTQASGTGGAIIVALAGASLTAPVSASSNTSSGNAVTTPSVTPEGSDDFEVRFAISGEAGSTWTTPGGFVEQVEVNADNQLAAVCATRVLASGAATGVQNFGLGSAPFPAHGYTIAITEAPSGRPRIVVATFAARNRAASW
jgi:hypothetical protein